MNRTPHPGLPQQPAIDPRPLSFATLPALGILFIVIIIIFSFCFALTRRRLMRAPSSRRNVIRTTPRFIYWLRRRVRIPIPRVWIANQKRERKGGKWSRHTLNGPLEPYYSTLHVTNRIY